MYARNKRPRDSQRSALYAWERRPDVGIVMRENRHPVALSECAAVVQRIWVAAVPSQYRRLVPRVVAAHGNRSGACYRSRAHEIHLTPWARQSGVVVHEIAHAIFYVRTVGHRNFAWHGPEFARLYCELAVAFLGHSMTRLQHAAANPPAGQRQVRIAGVNDLPWRVMRKARMAAWHVPPGYLE